jgi:hypothetical protein
MVPKSLGACLRSIIVSRTGWFMDRMPRVTLTGISELATKIAASRNCRRVSNQKRMDTAARNMDCLSRTAAATHKPLTTMRQAARVFPGKAK